MSTCRAAKPATDALTHALTAAAALATAALTACQSTSPLLFENRLERNIKVDAVVPVFVSRKHLWYALSPVEPVYTGSYQRSALVNDHALWDAAQSSEGERYMDPAAQDFEQRLSLSIRDASLINPRFAPLTVNASAAARTGYLAVAEAIDGNVYLILADDKGTKLDQAYTPLFPPK